MSDTKYQVDLESQVDLYIIYPISRAMMPMFRSLSFTPNGITTLSLITMIMASYYASIDTRIASIFFISSYIFDCADGMYARKFKMTSAFGMAYDYVKDAFVNTVFYIIFLWRYIDYFNLNPFQVMLIVLTMGYLSLTSYNVNEAVNHYKNYGTTDYYSFRTNVASGNKLWEHLYKIICKITFFLVKPYIKNVESMNRSARILKYVGMGNLFLILFLIMNIWVIK